MQYQYVQSPYYNSFPQGVYPNGFVYPQFSNTEVTPGDFPVRNKDVVAQESKKKVGHTHAHGGSTTCQDGHVHLHPGVTSTPIETEEGHIHKVFGNTTFDDGHIHSYEAYSSPPIPLPHGYHTHYAEFKTTKKDGHVHIIKGFTQPSKSKS